MIKKSGHKTSTKRTEDMVSVKKSVDANARKDRAVPVEAIQLQEKVNSYIHERLTDMWLLTTGEDFEVEFVSNFKHNGRPLAIVSGGQLRLMESRPVALDALRTVGIEMS